ncbi:class I SAM-dependent methyltransferase [Pseudomonadota bacterium]
MKISEGLTEEGIVVGNAFDKYQSRNPIVKTLMKGFESALADLVTIANPASIHEVGCGEGFHTLNWKLSGFQVSGSDFSSQVIELAKENAAARNVSSDIFDVRSVYDLRPKEDSADLIVCCEVLEHLEFPEKALQAISRVSCSNIILSVPREPIWRTMNAVRGKYVGDLGNTPGHIQHWSKKSFIQLVSSYFQIREIRSPIPWTMLLCSKNI